jgi:hypothetical protein
VDVFKRGTVGLTSDIPPLAPPPVTAVRSIQINPIDTSKSTGEERRKSLSEMPKFAPIEGLPELIPLPDFSVRITRCLWHFASFWFYARL